jgi:hypothetical protein
LQKIVVVVRSRCLGGTPGECIVSMSGHFLRSLDDHTRPIRAMDAKALRKVRQLCERAVRAGTTAASAPRRAADSFPDPAGHGRTQAD